LLSALDDAGGAPALLRILSEELDLDAVSVTGETLRQIVERAPGPDGEVLRPLSNPVAPQSGVRILHGSLAPGGAVLKVAGADPALRKHTGPAIVFNGSADLLARIHDPALGATADSVLVLRNAGPVGGPGMPEAGGIPIPEPLFAAGVRDIIRLSDARMSGTQAGSMILHVTPEAAVGGPLALVQDGDLIALDADAGTLDLLVDPEVLAARAPAAKPEAATRGYEALYVKHVLQADQGCDFDFLVGSGGSGRTTEVTSEHG
jgi:dihydroxy-acid dehydratase